MISPTTEDRDALRHGQRDTYLPIQHANKMEDCHRGAEETAATMDLKATGELGRAVPEQYKVRGGRGKEGDSPTLDVRSCHTINKIKDTSKTTPANHRSREHDCSFMKEKGTRRKISTRINTAQGNTKRMQKKPTHEDDSKGRRGTRATGGG